jgi:hypothetical protein
MVVVTEAARVGLEGHTHLLDSLGAIELAFVVGEDVIDFPPVSVVVFDHYTPNSFCVPA